MPWTFLRPSTASLGVTVALLGAVASLGCNANCDRNPDVPPVLFTEGFTDHDRGFYSSAAFQGPYLEFAPGRTYRFVHRLGAPPCSITPWLAFEEFPVAPGVGENHSGSTIGIGNQATIERVTATYIDIHNDTCSNIFLRLTAGDPEPFCARGEGSLDAGLQPVDAGARFLDGAGVPIDASGVR